MNREKITGNQALLLIISQAIAMFIVLSSFIFRESGRDGWLSITIAFAIGTVFLYIIFSLNKLYPLKTIIEYLQVIWGETIGKILGFIIVVSFFITSIFYLRGTSGNVRGLYMETPQVLLTSLSATLIVYAMYKGIAVITKTSNHLLTIVLISAVFILIAIIPDVHFENIKPVLEDGIFPVLKGIPLMLSILIKLAFFVGFISPYIKKTPKMFKKLTYGWLFAGVFQGLISIYYLAFFDLKFLQNNVIHAFYTVVRYIFVANFLSGFEVLFMIVWLANTFFLLIGCFYPCIIGLAQLLNFKSFKPLIMPIIALAVSISTIIPNPIYNKQLYSLYAIFAGLVLGVICIATYIKVRFKKKKALLNR